VTRYTFQGDQDSHDQEMTYLHADGTEAYLGVYGQGELTLGGRLRVTGGLRLDQYLDSFGSALSPRLSVVYSPTGGTTLKLLLGRAFRAPNIYERFFEVDLTDTPVRRNPGLRPEVISTLEGVVEQFLGENLRVALAAYHYAAEDLIAQTQTSGGTFEFENVAAVDADGVELELEGKWGRTQARLSYGWQRAVDRSTGARLTNSPSGLFKLNLIVPLIPRRLVAGVESQYLSGRGTPQGMEVPPYFLTHLTVVAPDVVAGLTLSLSVKNLFDEDYQDPGSIAQLQNGIRQDARTFWLKAAYRH
jgi:iron complex outermembrane receptor protein